MQLPVEECFDILRNSVLVLAGRLTIARTDELMVSMLALC